MSFFVEILKCLLCCEKEYQDDSDTESWFQTRNRNLNRNPSADYRQVPYSSFPRTSAASNTTTSNIHTHFISQSNSQTSIRNVQSQNHSNSFVKPNNTIDSVVRNGVSIQIKPETAKTTLEKIHEISQKPNTLTPSSSAIFDFQTKNSGAKKENEKKHSQNLSKPSLTSSKQTTSLSSSTPASLSSSSYSFFAPSVSVKAPSTSTKPAPSPVSEKSSEVHQKLKILSSPFSTTSVVPRNTIKPAPIKTDDHKLSGNTSSSLYKPVPSFSKLPLSSSKPSPSLSGLPPLSPKPASSLSSSFSCGTPVSSPKLRPSTKPILYSAPSNLANHQGKNKYSWVEKGTSPIYAIPEDIKCLFMKGIVPGILKKPLSPSSYKDYFDALLYAEDYYLEKWDGFEMENVTLELHEAEIYKRRCKHTRLNENNEKDDKIFVAFELDSIPERRPFLLSRDFASVWPSGRTVEPFQGIIYRVVKSTRVLVEFGEDFHSKHYPTCKYNVKFSFNRVCLKRAHQAIAAASNPSFRNFLFPACMPRTNCVAMQLLSVNQKLDMKQVSAVRHILSLQGPPPYLVEGQISVIEKKQLSKTGMVVREAVCQIYQTFPSCRILICAPLNSTCDVFMRNLKMEIPESKMFRANAAFRELYEVPEDILPSCLYEEDYFSCPSLQELRNFKVILSTFMSSFRLYNEGILAGHFSHIFLVDASSATEPETMVALANLANEETTVVITGAPRNRSGWIRSKIARQNGLMTSYYERLRASKLYESLDPKFITQM